MPSDDDRPKGTATAVARPDRAELARVHDARERAIAALSDGFANDVLDVDEFERRVTLAHTSESAEEIAALTDDLPLPLALAASSTALGASPAPTVALATTPPDDGAAPETVYAIFGGVERRGSWTVPRRWRVVATFGGALLDLREARFPTGVIDLEVRAVLGGVQILVPPGLAVEVRGTAIMGGFQNVNRAPAHPDPDAPLLRIHGLAFMGGVDITMRLPGESEHQAHHRRKIESRQERRALRDTRREDRRHQRSLDRLHDDS
jgi:Domain of unknown function (DUF1707)/Cell wall-active antibiotics response 4TMS YvqF